MSESIVVTSGRNGARMHRSTCKKINQANVIQAPLDSELHTPASCCKPGAALIAEFKLARDTPPAEAPAKRVRSEGPAVTCSLNGKPRLVKTSPRPYTFSYLAGEVLGGKGASARLRAILAEKGIENPDHSEWEAEVEGKKIGAKLAS
jgi:hypothetical protein